ncbi:MAG: hypothetical protein ACXW2A_18635 [Burkholderiales bacterium]
MTAYASDSAMPGAVARWFSVVHYLTWIASGLLLLLLVDLATR